MLVPKKFESKKFRPKTMLADKKNIGAKKILEPTNFGIKSFE